MHEKNSRLACNIIFTLSFEFSIYSEEEIFSYINLDECVASIQGPGRKLITKGGLRPKAFPGPGCLSPGLA
jgi:hypothetical protein